MDGIDRFDLYFSTMLQGLFTGLGVVLSQWIWKKYFEKRFNKVHKKIREITSLSSYTPRRK